MTATRDSAVSGDMLFFDNYVPRLEDGDYTITVTQKLVGTGEPGFGGEKHDADRTFTRIQKFTVTGPRFQLDPTDIHCEFPPPGSQGLYDQFMPHVALRKRALPWERDVFKDKGVTPWVALLVFDTSEILEPAVGTAAATANVKPNPTRATSITLQSLKQPGPGVVAPDVTFHPYENAATTMCRAIDVSPATFNAIVPAQEDFSVLGAWAQGQHSPQVHDGHRRGRREPDRGRRHAMVLRGDLLTDPEGASGGGQTRGEHRSPGLTRGARQVRAEARER